MKRMIFIIITICILVYLMFFTGIKIREYNIYDNRIKDEIKILQISDLHSSIYGKSQKSIIEKIEKINPDVVFLTGDIIDDKVDIIGANILLEYVGKNYLSYYVTGNHEYWKYDIEHIKKIVTMNNIKVLNNEVLDLKIKGNDINVGGIDDPDSIKYDKKLIGKNVDFLFENFKIIDEDFSILLSHRPELISYFENYNIDLVLSGHAHGGQAAIPFLINGLYAPHQGIFPKFAGGFYKFKEFNLVVSRGLSRNLLLPRIFNPQELVVINLKNIDNNINKN